VALRKDIHEVLDRGAFLGGEQVDLRDEFYGAPGYYLNASTVRPTRQGSRQELVILRDWFSQFDSAAWDKQFEEDVAGGREISHYQWSPGDPT
jgi:hypothetical protein